MIDPRHARIAPEGSLLGRLIGQGVSRELTVLRDGAGLFDVFVHALCWLHAERSRERLVPRNEKHRKGMASDRAKLLHCHDPSRRRRFVGESGLSRKIGDRAMLVSPTTAARNLLEIAKRRFRRGS